MFDKFANHPEDAVQRKTTYALSQSRYRDLHWDLSHKYGLGVAEQFFNCLALFHLSLRYVD